MLREIRRRSAEARKFYTEKQAGSMQDAETLEKLEALGYGK